MADLQRPRRRVRLRKARHDRAKWVVRWSWYSAAVWLTLAVFGGLAAAAVFEGERWLIGIAGGAFVLVPFFWWLATIVWAARHPFPRWQAQCAPTVDPGEVSFQIAAIGDQGHGAAYCRVTTPNGYRTPWTAHPAYGQIEELFISTKRDRNTMGWRYPSGFPGSPALSDGSYKVEWRLVTEGYGKAPLLAANARFTIADEECQTAA